MGPLARSLRSASPRGGFTLVEILVVIAIAAIAVSLAVANLADDGRRATEREAKRFAGALEHAAALAQWQRATLGVSAEGALYRFWSRDASDRWMPLTGDDVLSPRTLPSGVTVAAAHYAGAPVEPNVIVPLRPSGRNEPYDFLLSSPVSTFVVSADPLNRVAFVPSAR